MFVMTTRWHVQPCKHIAHTGKQMGVSVAIKPAMLYMPAFVRMHDTTPQSKPNSAEIGSCHLSALSTSS